MKRVGRLEEAHKYYLKSMELDSTNPIFQYNTGVLYNIKSEYDKAVDMLERSIERNPENVYAYLALGDALERKKETAKAITVYKELMSQGIPVHGLDEKLKYLEKAHEESVKKEKEAHEKELAAKFAELEVEKAENEKKAKEMAEKMAQFEEM